ARVAQGMALERGDGIRTIVGGKVAAGSMIATEAHATKGKFTTGTSRLAVPIDDASPNAMQEIVKVVDVVADKAGRQAEACLVGTLDGIVQVPGGLDPQQWAKVFPILNRLHTGGSDQPGCN